MTLLITGGAGFIGSNFCHLIRKHNPDTKLVILDALTYAGNLENLEGVLGGHGVTFVHGSITNAELVERMFNEYHPDVVINFAAETHVDKSVHDDAGNFVQTNINGVHVLLEALKKHGGRMVQISTDEVYGTLPLDTKERFTEDSPIKPNSPYSSTKASAELLCRAYHESFGVDVVITRCTNNFGPREFPEKVIPYWITRLMEGKKIPLYGDGKNVRDWIHVNDHCQAIAKLITAGEAGEAYNIGVGNEMSNLELARIILQEFGLSEEHMRMVQDRPGHDRRYALDASKLFKTIEFKPEYTRHEFQKGIQETIAWYKENQQWIDNLKEQYGEFNPHITDGPDKKVLIIGTGFLGSQYVEYFAHQGYDVKGVDKEQCDITKIEQIRNQVEIYDPDIIISAVAMADIDWCEQNRGKAIEVNTIGADNVASVAQEFGKYLVHISSGCVQESSSRDVVHTEESEVSPVCFYSWTKVFADQLILDRVKRHGLKALLLRPRQLLSAKLSPRNALAKMLSYNKFIDTDNSCTVVDDLLFATKKLVEQEAEGLYNIVNPGVTSPYQIALKLKEIIKQDMHVNLISKQELNMMTFAQRIDAVLSTDKLQQAGIELAPIEQRMDDVIRELKKNLSSPEAGEIMQNVAQDTVKKLSLRQTTLA